MLVPGVTTEAEDLSETDAPDDKFTPIVLDLTSGSGLLTVACAEAGYSLVAYEVDTRQATSSGKILKKHLTAGGFTSAAMGFNALEEEEDIEDAPAVVRQLQGAFIQTLHSETDEY